ncbi:hypothetical protein GJ496_005867 [Pomphorhynchus laevis]|nr:hypothetical protein GJ496_005867 [Pomphorhynchus laevis]
MTRLQVFVKAAFVVSSAAAVAISGQYIGQSAKYYLSLFKTKLKKNKYFRRYVTGEFGGKVGVENSYVEFKPLPFTTIQSKKSLQKLKKHLITKKHIPNNINLLVESLHDFQVDHISKLIPPEIAIRLALSSQHNDKGIVNLIYKGKPLFRIDEENKDYWKRKTQLDRLLLKIPNDEEQCFTFIKEGGLEYRLRHYNEHEDNLKIILPITYFIPDQEIFYHTGWIRKLSEIMFENSANFIQQQIDGLACLENLRNKRGQFIDRMVLPLYVPDESSQPIADLIFVHGMWGSCYHTWRQDSCPITNHTGGNRSTFAWLARRIADNSNQLTNQTSCWPRDWLAKDLCGSVRILAVNYNSDQVESLENLTDLVRQRLLNCGVGQRPIIWVGHSMGGLLIKHLSVLTEFSESTSGFVFYSVPHHGCPLINEFIASVSSIFRQISPINNTYLKQIHSKWSYCFPKANVLSFVEKLPIRIPPLSVERVIVDKYSAFIGQGQFYNMSNKNHINVCKPLSKDGIDYKIVIEFINELMLDLLKDLHKSTLLDKVAGEQCSLGPEFVAIF